VRRQSGDEDSNGYCTLVQVRWAARFDWSSAFLRRAKEAGRPYHGAMKLRRVMGQLDD
jgi:hypothetical protein